MCKKGGLVNQRHDEIKFERHDLAVRALILSKVRQIKPDRSADVDETDGMSTPREERGERGDLLIKNLW